MFASNPFLPTFSQSDPGSETGCRAPVPQGMIGEGRNLPQGANLLNVAGEKTESNDTLGYPYVLEFYRMTEFETALLPVDESSISLAARLLREGQVVAFPTETVYGLGADGLNEQAVKRIFAAKNRPADNPLILHIAAIEDAYPLCQWTSQAQELAQAFWPGPLTMLLSRKSLVPGITTAGLPTVALRMPAHPAALALIKAAGIPIAAPSANLSGRPSPTSAMHVYEDMLGRVPLILDGGECQVGVESTVLDMSGDVPTIYRPGAVTGEQIAMVAGECKVAPSVMRPLSENESAPSPGMRHRHYAPKARMTLVKGATAQVAAYINQQIDQGENACILAFEEHLPLYGARDAESLGHTAQDAAQRLFYLLRDMDTRGISRIYAETLPETGLGLAVMNRMARAAAFDIITV